MTTLLLRATQTPVNNTDHQPVFTQSHTYMRIVLVRDVIYISYLCYGVSVRLSVTAVHWRIIANLGFNFQSKFTTHCGRGEG